MKKNGFLRDFALKPWEAALVAAFFAMFCVSAYWYLSGFSFRRFFYGNDEAGGYRKMGLVADIHGTLRRESAGQLEFAPIQPTSRFDRDTLVTSSDSHASVTLDDGSILQMEPGAMVRLSMEDNLSLSGISRATHVDLVYGKVSAQAKERKIVVQSAGRRVVVQPQSEAPHPRTFQVPKAAVAQAAPASSPLLTALTQDIAPPPPPSAVPPSAPEAFEVTAQEEELPLPPPAATPTAAASSTVAAVASPVPSAGPSVAASAAPTLRPSPLPSPSFSPSPQPTSNLPPKLAPIPELKTIEPKQGAHLKIPDNAKKVAVDAVLKWKNPGKAGLGKLTVFRLQADGGDAAIPILDRELPIKAGLDEYTVHIDTPGSYAWVLKKGPSQAGSQFFVERNFMGIKTVDVLVGGEKMSSNRWIGKNLSNFEITLKWTPVPGAESYHIWFGKNQNPDSTILEKDSDDPEFSFDKDKVVSGWVFYKISTTLPSGFVTTTDTQPFNFSFLPPALVSPADGSSQAGSRITGKPGLRLLFTWEKTLFTDTYLFELSKTEDFSGQPLSQKTTDNFLLFTTPGAGTYYWRIQSFAKSLASPPSKAYKVTVTPGHSESLVEPDANPED